jgi:hypothetical protein
MTLIIIGIIIVALSLIGAALNVGFAARGMFRDDFDDTFNNFGDTFGRQAVIAVFLVIGVAIALVGLVLELS